MMYLRNKFPWSSEGKIKENVFIGPQMKAMLKSENFESKLINLEKRARVSSSLSATTFLEVENQNIGEKF